jgi:hypothetical protein
MQELQKIRAERPRIADQFADLKANLSVVSHDEWAAIPDIGDYTVKHKNRKLEANAPVPESILGTRTQLLERETLVVSIVASALVPLRLCGYRHVPALIRSPAGVDLIVFVCVRVYVCPCRDEPHRQQDGQRSGIIGG